MYSAQPRNRSSSNHAASRYPVSIGGRYGTSNILATPTSLSMDLRAITTLPRPQTLVLEDSLSPCLNITDGLASEPLQSIEKPSPKEVEADKVVKVNDLRAIGSYNWVKKDVPTIIVPGSPPEWQNRPPPYNVQPDTGLYFSDQNKCRIPSATLLPLIKAVEIVAEDAGDIPFNWSSVDYVADRNELNKLLKWVEGINVQDFRIDMQLAGTGTVLLIGWSSRTRERYSGRTYRSNFEKASTAPAPGCQRSTGHNRIVTYDLSGMKMVVQFEVDACIPPATNPASRRRRSSNMDDLMSSLALMKISLPSTRAPSGTPGLNIIKAGTLVPQSSIIELTTCPMARKVDFSWTEAYPRLFLSQTAHYVLAIHQRGRFLEVIKRKVFLPDLQEEEAKWQTNFKRLRRSLDVITNLVIQHGLLGRLSLVCLDGELMVYRRECHSGCLPDEYMLRFSA